MIFGGTTGVSSDGTLIHPNFNNLISKCTIVYFGSNGISFQNGSAGMTVEDCFISTNNVGINATNPRGIRIESTYDGYILNIRRNKIIDIKSTSSSSGLSVIGIGTSTPPGTNSVLNIENNFIALNASNNNASATYGILTTGTTEAYTTNIYFNTIRIGGSQTGGLSGTIVSAGIISTITVPEAIYNSKNNICINTRSGVPSGFIHTANAITNLSPHLNINYNIYYATAANDAFHAVWGPNGYNSLPNYKTAAFPNEQNTVFKNVNFVSNTDLHLTVASLGDPDLIGSPVPGITTDIDHQIRNATSPYKGGDEITMSTLNLTVNLEACSPMPDTIIVSLRSTVAPYNLIETSKAYLSTSGTATINFANAVNGISYYIVVNHRNSIETWSKSGGEVFSGGVLNYDFTSAASQAFGNNMILVGSKYSFYTGDVNQDGVVDLTDLALIDNDAFNFVSGFANTDLNCDITDAAFADNNTFNFVSVIRP